MKKIIKLLILVCISLTTYAQSYVLKGTIMDSKSGEKLSGVHVQLLDQNQKYFSVSNLNGEFIIRNVESGDYTLSASYLGYEIYKVDKQINSDLNFEILLQQTLIHLGEAKVTSLRQERMIKDISVPMEVTLKKDIEASSSFTVSDVLQQEPGVVLASDGVWATGINIRGLSQQRIVMLVDGNRIETATDLMASMSFFDVDDVERIEILKSASSSLYGTGAMGGIVNVITNEGYFNSSTYFNGSFNTGFNTVNELFTRKLSFKSGSERWYFTASGALRNANDINTPEGEIDNSQFEDKSISLTAGLKVKDNHSLKLKYQYFDADDVGIPGGDAFPGPAKATYTDAKRWMLSANYEIKDISDRFKLFNFKYFHQYILRDVELFPNTVTEKPATLTIPDVFYPSGTHITDGFQLQTNWKFTDKNDFIVGIDLWRRKIETSRKKYIDVYVKSSGVTNHLFRDETPIPNSCFGSGGIYFQDEQKLLNDDLKLIVGGRLDGIRIANEQAYDVNAIIMNDTIDNTPDRKITFEENEEYKISWSANIGLLYSLNESTDLTFSAGRSFRAPSLEESFKYIDLGSYVRLGDPNLDPEKGYSVDLGIRIWKPKFSFKLDGYVNWLSDMIVEESGDFIYNTVSGSIDTIPALINTNVDEARLYGVDFSTHYNFYSNWIIYISGSYVRGEDILNSSDLPLIPPFNGRVGIRYNLPGYFGTELIAIGFADQHKVAEGETETNGYTRYDFRVNSSAINLNFARVQIFGGIENIFDRAYTNHLSTNRGLISIEPGRNFYIKLKVLF